MSFVLNPKTNRMIKVGGPTYKKLFQEEHKKVSKKSTDDNAKELKNLLSTMPSSRKSKIATLEKLIKSAEKGEGRGSRTRGWGAAAPQRGKERNELLARCGDRCFLLPSDKKFPVCAALRVGENCKPNCAGIMSAKIRARQHKYENVARMADEMLKLYC